MNMKDYTATTISFSVITHLKLQNDVFHVKFFYTIVLLEENQISPFSNFIIINTQLIVDYLSFTHRQRWTFEHNRWKELSLGYSLWLSKKISNQIRVLLSVDQSEQWENREKKKSKVVYFCMTFTYIVDSTCTWPSLLNSESTTRERKSPTPISNRHVLPLRLGLRARARALHIEGSTRRHCQSIDQSSSLLRLASIAWRSCPSWPAASGHRRRRRRRLACCFRPPSSSSAPAPAAGRHLA